MEVFRLNLRCRLSSNETWTSGFNASRPTWMDVAPNRELAFSTDGRSPIVLSPLSRPPRAQSTTMQPPSLFLALSLALAAAASVVSATTRCDAPLANCQNDAADKFERSKGRGIQVGRNRTASIDPS